MRLEITPAVDPLVEDALASALHEAGFVVEHPTMPDAWGRAALDEAVDPGDAADYARSRRRTRGATRA